jgi:hypothetical protein
MSPASGPYSAAQVSRTAPGANPCRPSGGSRLIVLVCTRCVPRPSSLLGSSFPAPPRSSAFLTVGLPGNDAPGPGRGFHVPHQRDTTGLGALSTPGTAVLTLAGCRARPAPAASQRPVPTPRCHHPPTRPRITRHQRGFTRFTRPVCPLPVIPGWNGNPRASLRASHPAVTSDARQRWGHDASTRPELRLRHQPDLQSIVHSQSATSCRNGRSDRLAGSKHCAGLRDR